MAIRRRTGKYWENRALERLTSVEAASIPQLNKIIGVYDDARKSTVASIKAMYAAYYTSEGWDKTALNSIAPTGDINRFFDDMAKAGLVTSLPDNYKGRMSRLELLNAQMWGEIKKAAQAHTGIALQNSADTVKTSYYHTIYDTAKGIGSTPTFASLDTQTVNEILGSKFMGKNYSERIWQNSDILAQTVQQKLAAAIASGQASAKTVRDIRDRFSVTQYQAQRLVQTETNYFNTRASIEAYTQMDIKQYVWSAILDSHTDDICADLDGEILDVSKAVAGTTAPPAHANCRCVLRPYIGKDYEPTTRIARDPQTGRNVYVTNMTYNQWAKSVNLTK